jgi:hypothetical protein
MTLRTIIIPTAVLASLFPVHILCAQQTGSDTISFRKDAVKLFLDCRHCDDDYIRREIPYVNYVRDVREAELFVIFTSQRAGNGGREYTLTFEGQKQYEEMTDTLSFTSMPDDTEDRVRAVQLQYLKLGLMRYVAKTPMASEVILSHNPELEGQEVVDRWDYWVFELGFYPEFEGEETYREIDMFSTISAQRITEKWKLEMDLDYHNERKRYFYEDTTYIAVRQGQSLEFLVVKSLNDHWSAGAELGFGSSTFSNYRLRTEFIPAIEYNIFPYSEATRRQLRILYGVGLTLNEYNHTTIYGKDKELLYLQNLKAAFEVRQKWGTIDMAMQASNYLHDFSKNRIELGGRLSIRIAKGLSFRVYGEIARVRDQISLAAGELSEAEILLRLQEMATGYYYEGGIGVSYTFGSIYNNIVNPRFGRY